MAIDFETIKTPKPASVLFLFAGEEITVIYDRAAFSSGMARNYSRQPIRERLAELLVGWDVLKNGVPWQPEQITDPVWDERVVASRANGHENLPVSNDDRCQMRRLTWIEIFDQLPIEFLREVDRAVYDDFLGVDRRK